jgi:F-type H+-transporting ATPase subunit a
MNFFQLSRDIPTVAPDIIFHIFGFPIANSTLMAFMVAVIVALTVRAVYKRRGILPSGFYNATEALYESIENLVNQLTGSQARTRQIFPLIGALIIFIGISNLIGLVPGLNEWLVGGKALFRPPTSDLNTTVALAAVMVIFIQIESMRHIGFFSHLGKYFQVKEVIAGFRQGIGEGFTAIIGFFVGFLDIVSEFAKVISLSLRLFGNIYAGAVLATIIMGAFAYGLPALWSGLSIFFGVVQAMVFSALVTAYWALGVPEEEVEGTVA